MSNSSIPPRNNNSDQLINSLFEVLAPTLRNIVPSRSNSVIPPIKIPLDVINEEKTMYIYAEIPGVLKESINVDFYNNKLTIMVDKVRNYEVPNTSEIIYGKPNTSTSR
mgnify:CR=1 FL=1